jgi:signal transduction histidine kinase
VKKYFPNRTAKITFAVLLSGFLLFLVAGQFVFVGIQKTLLNSVNHQREANQIMRVYSFVDRTPADTLTKNVNDILLASMVSDLPDPGSELIIKPNLEKINSWMSAHPFGGRLALQLSNQQWLNVNFQFSRPFLIPFFGLLALGSIVIIGLVLLCFWAVKRLADPLVNLAHAISQADGTEHLLPANNNNEADAVINIFNKLQSRISNAIRLRTQMLAAISHDLRTPITRLKLRAEYLTDKTQYAKVIADLTEMEDMISSVLTFTREDRLCAVKEELDLNALLDSLCHDFSDAGFAVTYHGVDTHLSFNGCLNALRRAFSNLIDNGLKYGKVVDVELQHDAQQIRIQIDDQGPGIPEQYLEQVFEPFYRLEQSRSRQTGGTGLGLTITRDIILAHNGYMQLLNRPQGGLRVVIIFSIV